MTHSYSLQGHELLNWVKSEVINTNKRQVAKMKPSDVKDLVERLGQYDGMESGLGESFVSIDRKLMSFRSGISEAERYRVLQEVLT